MKRISFLLFSLCVVFVNNSTAQIDSVYVRNFGGSGEEAPGFGAGTNGAPNIRAVADSQGNVYMATYTNSTSGDIQSNAGSEDVFVVKSAPDGELIWAKTFGGSGFDRAFSIKLLSDGNIILSGRSSSNDGTFGSLLGTEDAFLLKLSADGNVIWSRLFGGSQPETFFDVLELPNGDLMACGISGSIDGDVNDGTYTGSNKAWLMRISSAGTPIWSRITNALIVDPDREESFWFARLNNAQDALYLLGASYNFNDINSDDLFLAKYDLNGAQQFKKTFGGNAGDSPAGLTINQNDEIFALGTIRGSGANVTTYFAGNADAWLVKLDATGTILWDKNYGGTDLDYAYGLTAQSEALLISMSSRSIDNISNRYRFGLSDGLIVEVSSLTGDTLSTYRWGSTANDYCHDVISMGEGEFYAVGRSSGNDEWISEAKGGSDLVLIKYRDNALQIKKVNNLEFSVYPNPSNGKIQMIIPANYNQLMVYNNAGLMVHNEALKEGLFVTSLEKLPQGIYVIQILSERNSEPLFKRIVIH